MTSFEEVEPWLTLFEEVTGAGVSAGQDLASNPWGEETRWEERTEHGERGGSKSLGLDGELMTGELRKLQPPELRGESPLTGDAGTDCVDNGLSRFRGGTTSSTPLE